VNAALLAVAILAVADPKLRAKLRKFRAGQEKAVRSQTLS
jgi:phosphoribosylcarboxyaminoimidazole (NCAIR) mutase